MDTNTSSGVAGQQLANVAGETKASIDDTTNSYFTGAGSKNNPYLVTNEQDFCNIATNEKASTRKNYYKVTRDLNFQTADFTVDSSVDGYGVVSNFNNADIDLGNRNIYMKSTSALLGWGTNLSLHNGNIYFQDEVKTYSGILGYYTEGSAYFENINTYAVNGTTTAHATSLYVGDVCGNVNYSFTNCNNYANIICDGAYFGLFIADSSSNQGLTFSNCNNYGNITAKRASMFVGQFGSNINISVENCSNNATIISTTATVTKGSTYPNNPYFALAKNNNSWSNVKVNGTAISNSMTLSGSGSYIYRNPDTTFALTKSGANITLTKATDATITKYVAKSSVTVNYMNKNDISNNKYGDQYGWSTYIITETINASDISGTTKVIDLKNYNFFAMNSYVGTYNNWDKYNNSSKENVTISGANYTVITVDGTQYYMIPSDYLTSVYQGAYPSATLYSGFSASQSGCAGSTIIVEAYAGDTLMYSVNLK